MMKVLFILTSPLHMVLHSLLVLRDFTVLPTIQSWWGWIFAGMEGSWTPYTESEEELKLLTKEGALLVVGEGDTTFKDVFNLTKVDSRTYTSVGMVNGVQVSQKITLPKSDVEGIERNTIDIEINISNQRSEKVDFWIGTMDKMDDESADLDLRMHPRPQFYVEEELVGTFGSLFGTSFLSLEDLDEPTKFDSAPEWFGIGSRYFLSALYPTNTTDFFFCNTRKVWRRRIWCCF